MWTEKETEYGYRLVEAPNAPTLGYSPESGVRILERDGLPFKDLARTGELLPYEDWRLPYEERAADLAGRLSVEEIAGLMCFSAHQRVFPPELTEEQKTFLDQHLRSVLNSGGLDGAENASQIHWNNLLQRYVEGKDYGIPCYQASDPRNGQKVSDWPGNLSLAASFDPELAREAAACQSRELRDLGIACFLAPQVDIGSDPRWARFSGTFGEDPALSRDMVRAFCDGLQSSYDDEGNDLGWGERSVTAMAKHWVGEGSCEGGREGHFESGKYAIFPGGSFGTHLVPFVDGAFRLAGRTGSAGAVMSSYSIAYTEDGSLGELAGSSYSHYKLNELLRGRYGFDGVVCTDWNVLNEGYRTGGICTGWGKEIEDRDMTPAERALRALLAGADQMGGCSNPAILVDAYRLGCQKLGREKTDSLFRVSARRLLLGIFRTGLFENPYLDETRSLADVNSADKQEAALEAQIRTVVMIKNENGAIRPRDRRLKVYLPALYEAAHQEMNHRTGLMDVPACVKWLIPVSSAERYFDVVTDRVEGNAITRPSEEELRDIDMILIAAKEPGNTFQQSGKNGKGEFIPLSRQYRPYHAECGAVRRVSLAGDRLEDGSRENRSYYGRDSAVNNEEQLDQILELAALAKRLKVPSVLAMFTGKPMCFHEFEPQVDAILLTFSSPSLYGGGDASTKALSAVAAGLREPSGLLPMQMPRDMEAVETQLEDVPRDMACYVDSAGHAYDFAYGLNYGGVIRDGRTGRYAKPPLTGPEN